MIYACEYVKLGMNAANGIKMFQYKQQYNMPFFLVKKCNELRLPDQALYTAFLI